MMCDWRSIKTGSRTKQREPLSPPTIPYWLPASYGLCFRLVTYVRRAVILDVWTKSWQKTAGLSRHEGWMYCSICTVCKDRTSFCMGGDNDGSQWKRWLAERQRLVMTQPRTRHQEVHEPAEIRSNERFFPGCCFMMITEMAGEQVVYSPFDHLTWLIDRESFIELWSRLWINRQGFEGRIF